MCSAPATPSIVSTFGQVRSMPRGIVQPWTSTISLFFAVAASTSSYQRIIVWPSDSMKSIFSPATPQDFHLGSSELRSAAVARLAWLVQMNTPTCLAAAYFTSVGIQEPSQPASTVMYSQPIFAAKSAAVFWSARFLLLPPLDHQDHSERPALIQEVSAIFDGLARSVTRSLPATEARLPMTIVRHGGVVVPVPVSLASGRVSLKWRGEPSRGTRGAPYPPPPPGSGSSNPFAPTWTSEGYPYPVPAAPPPGGCPRSDTR